MDGRMREGRMDGKKEGRTPRGREEGRTGWPRQAARPHAPPASSLFRPPETSGSDPTVPFHAECPLRPASCSFPSVRSPLGWAEGDQGAATHTG